MVKTEPKKTCPNCEHEFRKGDLFCSHCGQENKDKLVSLKTLLSDFLGDYFTFDSRFLRSIIPLLFKPGKLTRDYLDGKQARYIPPLRILVFSSVILLLLLSMMMKGNDWKPLSVDRENPSRVSDGGRHISTSFSTDDEAQQSSLINFTGDLSEIDSLLISHTPAEIVEMEIKPDSKLEKFLWTRGLELYANNGEDLVSFLISNGTIALIFILPIFALLLKLFFFRYPLPYTGHLIFAVHFHGFLVLLMILFQLFSLIAGINPFWVYLLIALLYLFFALRAVYRQMVLRSLAKLLGITLLYGLLIVPVYGLFLLIVGFLLY